MGTTLPLTFEIISNCTRLNFVQIWENYPTSLVVRFISVIRIPIHITCIWLINYKTLLWLAVNFVTCTAAQINPRLVVNEWLPVPINNKKLHASSGRNKLFHRFVNGFSLTVFFFCKNKVRLLWISARVCSNMFSLPFVLFHLVRKTLNTLLSWRNRMSSSLPPV